MLRPFLGLLWLPPSDGDGVQEGIRKAGAAPQRAKGLSLDPGISMVLG